MPGIPRPNVKFPGRTPFTFMTSTVSAGFGALNAYTSVMSD